MAPTLTPPPSTQLCRTQTFAHVGEYVRPMHALAPLAKTIATLHHVHPLVKVDIPPFVNYFHPKMDFIFDRDAFISTLTSFPRLSSNSPSNMVYQFLQDYFVLDDSISGFVDFFRYANMSLVVMFFH